MHWDFYEETGLDLQLRDGVDNALPLQGLMLSLSPHHDDRLTHSRYPSAPKPERSFTNDFFMLSSNIDKRSWSN